LGHLAQRFFYLVALIYAYGFANGGNVFFVHVLINIRLLYKLVGCAVFYAHLYVGTNHQLFVLAKIGNGKDTIPYKHGNASYGADG
jgi:hypothetical protein